MARYRPGHLGGTKVETLQDLERLAEASLAAERRLAQAKLEAERAIQQYQEAFDRVRNAPQLVPGEPEPAEFDDRANHYAKTAANWK